MRAFVIAAAMLGLASGVARADEKTASASSATNNGVTAQCTTTSCALKNTTDETRSCKYRVDVRKGRKLHPFTGTAKLKAKEERNAALQAKAKPSEIVEAIRLECGTPDLEHKRRK